MTPDEIISMGNFCAALSVDENFNKLISLYEKQTISLMLSTKLTEGVEREKIFSTLQGVRDFIGLMQEFIVQRKHLLAPKTVDQTDDPNVHNLFD